MKNEQTHDPNAVIDPDEDENEPMIEMIQADDEYELKEPKVRKKMGRIP